MSATQERPTLPTPYVDLDRRGVVAPAREPPDEPLGRATSRGCAASASASTSAEVEEVYLPLSRLLHFYVEATHGAARTRRASSSASADPRALRGRRRRVGRRRQVDDVARILRELLTRWPHTPRVQLVTTDGFLLPNAELERRGLMERKGFPESYDRRALLRFMAAVKAGDAVGARPLYSHLTYDVVPDARGCAAPTCSSSRGSTCCSHRRAPDGSGGAISDYFDFSVYVDAPDRTSAAGTWSASSGCGRRRSPTRSRTSTGTRGSPTRRRRSHGDARSGSDQRAEPRRELMPTRERATLVLTKGADHAVTRIRLRKI